MTFAADVARILQEKCQSCHRPGQVGPFSLLTYDDARRHAATIREVVDDRRMPPWHADPRYGHFENDRSLTARERATLLAWVDQGSPAGRSRRRSPPPRSSRKGWTIGTPDVVFEIPEPYTVSAQGVLPYVNLRVPHELQGGSVDPGGRGRPGRSLGRPPHHRLRRRPRPSPTDAAAVASTSAATRPATCPRSIPPGPPRRSRPGPT